jgi:hypothetical protein
MGWTGDAALTVEEAIYNFGVPTTYAAATTETDTTQANPLLSLLPSDTNAMLKAKQGRQNGIVQVYVRCSFFDRNSRSIIKSDPGLPA